MPDPTPGTPRTEAGRRLVSFIERGFDLQPVGVALETVDALILAIEAEAATGLDVERLYRAVEATCTGNQSIRQQSDRIAAEYERLTEPPDA